MRADDPGGKRGCSNVIYCRDGHPKPSGELERMRKPTKPSGSEHNRDCSLFDRLCNEWVEVDRLFDPYMGPYPYEGMNYDQPFDYTNTSPEVFDDAMADMYEQLGIDLSSAPRSNPLTEEKFREWADRYGLDIAQLQKQVFYINAHHEPYGLFLSFAGIPRDDNYLNYESNYLNALMSANPGALRSAKDYYFKTTVLRQNIWLKLFNEGTPLKPASGGPPNE